MTSSDDAPVLDVDTLRRQVRVVLKAPPCERSFSLQFRSNGELRAVEIDGVYYGTVRRKRTTILHEGDRIVTLVGLVLNVE